MAQAARPLDRIARLEEQEQVNMMAIREIRQRAEILSELVKTMYRNSSEAFQKLDKDIEELRQRLVSQQQQQQQ